MIKGQPCKVADVSTSKTGKHGHAKCNFIAYNIFNNKKLEDMIPSTHGTTVPVVTRTEYTLLDITDEDFLSLMDENGDAREDLKARHRVVVACARCATSPRQHRRRVSSCLRTAALRRHTPCFRLQWRELTGC